MPETTAAAGVRRGAEPKLDLAAFNALLAPYKEPSLGRALRQLADTVLPLAALWAAMYALALGGRAWAALLLAVPAGGVLMRLFIIQHDCGHGSFFRSARANDLLGGVLGVLTVTPYKYWAQTHAIHHSASGNLDKRGWGDIHTMTVAEWGRASSWDKWWYRVYRSAPILFVLGPVFHFLFYHRVPFIVPRDWTVERRSILKTDLGLALLALLADRTVGLGPFLLVHAATWCVAAWGGVWFFYVQHQYEGAYWRRSSEWDFARAGLEGSSWYDLPRWLQWFTGNIGFHHVHHLNSRVPNYRLEAAVRENPELQRAPRFGFLESLKTIPLALWDEERRKMVPLP